MKMPKKGNIPWNKGLRGLKGHKHTDETKKLISSKLKGRKISEETKEKLRQIKLKNPTRYWLGKKQDKETIKKMSKTKKKFFDEGKLVIWNKGLTKDTDERLRLYGIIISKAKKGKPSNSPTKFKKGHKTWNKGIPMPIEIRKKLLIANIGRKLSKEHKQKISKATRLEKNPAWKGGKSFEPYSIRFNKRLKNLIRKRDNFMCQECYYTEKQLSYNLQIHHIDYDKKNSNPNNLISLCRSCHTQTNFNRGSWANYYQEKVMMRI